MPHFIRLSIALALQAVHLWWLRRQERHLEDELRGVLDQLTWLPPHKRVIENRLQIMRNAIDAAEGRAHTAGAVHRSGSKA